jgi:hypothetical protein
MKMEVEVELLKAEAQLASGHPRGGGTMSDRKHATVARDRERDNAALRSLGEVASGRRPAGMTVVGSSKTSLKSERRFVETSGSFDIY